MAGRITISDVYQAEGIITIPLTLLDDGTPLNITGWTLSARIGIRGNKNLITKTIGAGITVDDAAGGKLTISFSAADLDRLPRNYEIELRRTGTGTERVLLTGRLELLSSLYGSV